MGFVIVWRKNALPPQHDGEQTSLALYMCFVMLRLYYERRVPDKL